MSGHLDFWYEFASTYSYLAAMRIEQRAQEMDVAVHWRPFLLGPIFAAQGLTTSPFNVHAEKGRHMWRDMARLCAADGLPLVEPDPFPANGLKAARLALVGMDQNWGPSFSRAVYLAEFAEGRDISDDAVLAGLLEEVRADPDAAMAAVREPALKDRLKVQTADAQRLGIFGAPTFVTDDGEMFWGNDRLEAALAWAAGDRRAVEF
ncbi:MAG: 2-hydroxychromene-2-carboxylate isomerase [Pseudomonadota bacterium]